MELVKEVGCIIHTLSTCVSVGWDEMVGDGRMKIMMFKEASVQSLQYLHVS